MTKILDNSKVDLYLFLEAFSFKLSEDNAYSWEDELREIIPFTSYQSNIEQYEKLYRRRKIWQKGCEEFGFEKELSWYNITICFMNAYGLGFLLLPIRYIATQMKIKKIGDQKIPKDKKYLKYTSDYRNEYRDLKRELSNYNRLKLILPVEESELQSIEKGFIKIDGESYFNRIHRKQEAKRKDDPDIDDENPAGKPIYIKIPQHIINEIRRPVPQAIIDENIRKRNERGITYITS